MLSPRAAVVHTSVSSARRTSPRRQLSPRQDNGHLFPTSLATPSESPGESKTDGLPLGSYLSWVKNEMDTESACMELPFTIILLISFSCLSYLHLNQSQAFAVEGALRHDIQENANFAWSHNFGHKTVFDVNSISDFWSWFRIGFLPLVIQQSWSYSEELQAAYNAMNVSQPYITDNLSSHWAEYGSEFQVTPIRGDYLHYNRLVGGIRMRQERSPAKYELCLKPDEVPEDIWKAWFGKPCMPASPGYTLTPEVSDAEAFAEEARVEWLMVEDSLHDLQQATVDMEDGCSLLNAKGRAACLCGSCSEGSNAPGPWLDEQTQRVEVAFVVYNSEYGLFSLVSVNFFFNRAGRIHKMVHVQSSWATDFARPFYELAIMVLCDMVWIVSLTYVFVCELSEIVKTVRSSKQRWYKSIWEEYIGLWNVVDWISIACAYLMVVMFVMVLFATNDVTIEFESIAKNGGMTGREQHISQTRSFFAQVEYMCSCERTYRFTFTIYPMVVMARLFKSFDAQPRLAVVTRTMVLAASDLAHFFIVFLSVYCCMAVNSILLFGQHVEDFATWDRAFVSCFLLTFGSWNWEEMKKVGILSAALWLWVFVLVISVLLLNMLLAILMDAYEMAKCGSTDARTLCAQTAEIIRSHRAVRRGRRVRLADIWAAFFLEFGDEKEMLESTEPMSAESILERVPGMKLDQAMKTLARAKEVEEARALVPYTQDDVKGAVDRIDSRTKLVREDVKKIRRIMEMYDKGAREPTSQEGDEPQAFMVEVVHNAAMPLAGRVETLLHEQGRTFSERHRRLAVRQDDSIACAQDAKAALQRLQASSNDAIKGLKQQLILQQRQAAKQRQELLRGSRLSTWATCADPTVAPQHRMSG